MFSAGMTLVIGYILNNCSDIINNVQPENNIMPI